MVSAKYSIYGLDKNNYDRRKRICSECKHYIGKAYLEYKQNMKCKLRPNETLIYTGTCPSYKSANLAPRVKRLLAE